MNADYATELELFG